MSNPFETYAERVKPQHERRKERAASKRRQTVMAKRAAEREALERQAALVDVSKLEELLGGSHGQQVGELVLRLEAPIAGGAELVRLTAELTWLEAAPADVRLEVLHLIGKVAVRLREERGLPPFDDGLPWERAGAVVQIREVFDGYDARGAAGLCPSQRKDVGA